MKDEIFYFIPELLSFLIILVCITAILLSTKFFGRYGLYAYSIDCNHNFKYSSFKTYTIFINFNLYLLRSSIVFDNICRRQYINRIVWRKTREKQSVIRFFGYMFFCYRNANSLLPPNFYQFRACKLAFRIRKNLFSSILSFYLKQN